MPLLNFNSEKDIAEARAATSAYNGFRPWWNAGASHMNQAVPVSTFAAMGLVNLLDQHRRLKYAS